MNMLVIRGVLDMHCLCDNSGERYRIGESHMLVKKLGIVISFTVQNLFLL